MELTRVQINIASADEISTLYDIGLRRAQQIVAYRAANGPFHGPTDLMKVKEITPKLAYTLAPHIDWQLPEAPEMPKARSWSDAALWIIILVCLLPATLLLLILVANAVGQTNTIKPIQIVAAAFGIAALLCFCAFAALRMGVALTRQRPRAQKLARAALASMSIALFGGIPVLLGSAAYWWYSVERAQNRSDAEQSFLAPSVGMLALLLLYLLMTPQIIVWWRPQLAESRWLALVFDSTFVLAGLMLIWAMREQVQALPVWLLLLTGLAGILVVIVAILSLRRGESFFRTSLDFLDPRRRLQAATTADHWRYWVATHLPDPVQQKQLQATLNAMHQSAPGQIILKTLIIGVGWWLLTTAAGAIVELYALGVWAKLFG